MAGDLSDDGQQIEAQMPSNEDVGTQRSNETKCRNPISSDCINICLKVFFVVLCIPWFISMVNFSLFDTECIVFEQASVLNCSQEYFISNPEHCIFAWLCMSIVSSFVFVLIICLNRSARDLNYQTGKFKQIWKRGSFWSLILLLIISSVFYFIRIAVSLKGISKAISVLLFIWSFVHVGVMCCWNYLPHVTSNCIFNCNCSCKCKCIFSCNCIIYWLALVMYLVETTFKLLAVTLDVAYDVAPVIENSFGKKYGKLRGVMVVVMGFNLGLHTKLVSFFWKKVFYGEKDLLSGPSKNLLEE